MAIVWSSEDVKYADQTVLANGIAVSVSVWKKVGNEVPIRFKRQKSDGTWPPDGEAVTIMAFWGGGATPKPLFIREVGGVMVIGDGFNFLMECRTDGLKPTDWRSI